MEALVEVSVTGGVVLIDERKPDLSYRLLDERARRRKRVLCVTREPPERVARRIPIETVEHVWLITGNGGRTVTPLDLRRVLGVVNEFLAANPGGTVLLDGVELLMVMNSYEEVRGFLAALHESLRRHRADGVVPIDTRTLTVRELRDLRGAFMIVRGGAAE